mmetsp:Transcript_6725/g.10340  ORF Transcript_6725/g.10340 Transcript_6725/m.10340 type:complete len:314 (+) Transcript_6725:24-965(+)
MKLFTTVFLFAILGIASCELSCPKVFDGLTNGHFDLATQFSVSEISANWVGLSNTEILGYEWAIISEDKAHKHLAQGDCRLNQGFSGIPDVQNWVDVKKSNSATATGLSLSPKTNYYVVLRTTMQDGTHVFSMSNGIFVLPQELNLEGSHKRVVEPKQTEKVTERNIQATSECPIDQANQCRKAQISVRDILSELYGPPRFVAFDPLFAAAAAVVGDDDDDDDDDGGVGPILAIIAGAIIGVLALLLICCLLLALLGLLFVKGGGEDKFTENVRTTHTEQVDADFGQTTEHAIADDTRVEFPDYDPSTRLSVA